MAKFPRPWPRKRRGKTYWYVTLDGKQLPLGSDKEKAHAEYHRIMSERGNAGPKPKSPSSDLTFRALCGIYLESLGSRREPRTVEERAREIARARKHLPDDLAAADIRKLHLGWIEQGCRSDGLSMTTVHHTLSAIQGVVSWSCKNDYLTVNPLVGYRKPPASGRNRVATPDEFRRIVRAAKHHPAFVRLIVFLRDTGCRPGEARNLRWDQVDFDSRLIVIRKHKTSTTQSESRPRVIPLTDRVVRLLRFIRKTQAGDVVFLNYHGRRWTRNAIVQAWSKAAEKSGVNEGKDEPLVAYSNRHTFATDALGKVSDIELAELMGHSNTRTLRRYTHVDAKRLAEIRRKIG